MLGEERKGALTDVTSRGMGGPQTCDGGLPTLEVRLTLGCGPRFPRLKPSRGTIPGGATRLSSRSSLSHDIHPRPEQ